MIDVACPRCGEPLAVPDSLAGKTQICPKCNTVCPVPKIERTVVADDPPPPFPSVTPAEAMGWLTAPGRGLLIVGVAILVVTFFVGIVQEAEASQYDTDTPKICRIARRGLVYMFAYGQIFTGLLISHRERLHRRDLQRRAD